MTQHTKGPWTAHIGEFSYADNVGSRPVTFGEDENVGRICVVSAIADRKRNTPYNAPDLERDANARLIAAAPDLLEALRPLIHQLEMAYEDSEDAANAYGVTEDIARARAAIARATGET